MTSGVAAAVLVAIIGTACEPPPPPPPDRTRPVTHLGGLQTLTAGWGPAPVSLTFDDGPHPTYTPQILDILDRYGVKATFFVLGEQVARHPHLAQEIVRRGHAIANHTWSHPDLTRLSAAQLNHQIHRTSDVIAFATARRPTCVRPPYGAINARVASHIWSSNHVPVNWSVDSVDWMRPGVGAIANRALTGARPGAVILFHDGGGVRTQTVAALPSVIEGLIGRGYQIVPTCMPFDLTPPTP